MNVTDNDILALIDHVAKNPRKREGDYLKEIAESLEELCRRPMPDTKAPQVTVNPPEVTVNTPELEPRVKKWTFEMKRDFSGKLETIVATAD